MCFVLVILPLLLLLLLLRARFPKAVIKHAGFDGTNNLSVTPVL